MLKSKAPCTPSVPQELPVGAPAVAGGGGAGGTVTISGPVTTVPNDDIITIKECFECLVDDVNGDGTVLVPFVRVTETIIRAVSGAGTPTQRDQVSECDNTPYTATNAVEPGSVGVATDEQAERRVITDSVWIAPQMTTSFTVTVLQGSATFTGSDGVSTTIPQGESVTWDYGDFLNTTPPSVAAGPADEVSISYIRLGA